MYKEKLLEQEERMAKELARINSEKMRDEKMRQHIKQNRWIEVENNSMDFVVILCSSFILYLHSVHCSVEIRELEAKLKSAYLNRARAAQIAEKEAMKYEAMVSANFLNYTKVLKI